MKVEIRQAKTTEEESAIITAVKMTDSIKSAVDILRDNAAGIAVSSGNDTLMILNRLIRGHMYIPRVIASRPNTGCMSLKTSLVLISSDVQRP